LCSPKIIFAIIVPNFTVLFKGFIKQTEIFNIKIKETAFAISFIF